MASAVLLLNLGTPAEPTAKGLRQYYRHFFSDPFVFDFNPLGRWLLRNAIILPFRAPRVAKDYEAIWMPEGSPLKVYADRMQGAVQAAFDAAGDEVLVRNAMNYSAPLLGDVMAELEASVIQDVLLLPMFPQYSTATTASVFHGVERAASSWRQSPRLRFVPDLFQEPSFVRSWARLIQRHVDAQDCDELIFSYHGVPEKTIRKADSAGVCQFGTCCDRVTEQNRRCYRMQCVQTTKAIVAELGWNEDRCSIAFQSRFGPLPWIQPYLDEHLMSLLESGKKRVAVVTPSFISDCLETVHEIGVEYREQFIEAGGESFQLVPNLNDDEDWFDAVYQIARDHLEAGDRG